MPANATGTDLHYIHRLSYSTRERMVGGFVLGGVLIVVVLLAFGGRHGTWFEDWTTLHAVFRQAGGISSGTKVSVSGIEVGKVESFDVTPDNLIVVNLAIRSRFRDLVRADSRASLNLLSVVGLASVEISAGSKDQPVLEEGARIGADEAPSFEEVLAGVVPALRRAELALERIDAVAQSVDPAKVAQAVDNLLAVSEHMARVSEQVAVGRGPAGALLFDPAIEARLRDSTESLARVLGATADRLGQLEGVFELVEDISQRSRPALERLPVLLAETTTLIGQMSTALDPVALERVTRSLARTGENVADMSDQLASGRGALGRVLFDEALERQLGESAASFARTLAATEQRLAELQPVFTAASEFGTQSSRTFEAVPGLVDETAKLVRQLNETVAVMSDQLYQFPDLVLRTRVVLEEMERTLTAVQNVWPVSGSVPPPEAAGLLELRPSNH